MHIDRTSTSGGSEKLAEWLLNPCKEAREIEERQEAVKELGNMPEWCGEYRVEGRLHRMTGENKEAAENWLKEEPFLKGMV
ncbi:MAG: hypothetical protein LIO65_01535 [Odoribacter sp.]|nr:hypothetical protein [Odoribacter sp.]